MNTEVNVTAVQRSSKFVTIRIDLVIEEEVYWKVRNEGGSDFQAQLNFICAERVGEYMTEMVNFSNDMEQFE